MNAYYYNGHELLGPSGSIAMVIAETAAEAAVLLTQVLGTMGLTHRRPLDVDRFVRVDLTTPNAIIINCNTGLAAHPTLGGNIGDK